MMDDSTAVIKKHRDDSNNSYLIYCDPWEKLELSPCGSQLSNINDSHQVLATCADNSPGKNEKLKLL
jgi:hypothetical protein